MRPIRTIKQLLTKWGLNKPKHKHNLSGKHITNRFQRIKYLRGILRTEAGILTDEEVRKIINIINKLKAKLRPKN